MIGRHLRKHALSVVAGLALTAAQVVPASAVTFNYSSSAGFEFGSAVTAPGFAVAGKPATGTSGVQFFQPAVNPNPALHPGNNAPPANTFTTIGWGCNLSGNGCAAPGNTVTAVDPFSSSARSALSILGLAGTVSDDGVFVTVSHIEHKNTRITGQTLANVVISSALRLSTDPETTDLQSLPISFNETSNQAPCGGPNPQGSICDDLFTLDVGTFEPLVITHEGSQFLVTFQLANLVNATFDPTTGTIFTAEGATSSLDFQMAITPFLVNEPGAIVLLGVGLIGIGFVLARRRPQIA